MTKLLPRETRNCRQKSFSSDPGTAPGASLWRPCFLQDRPHGTAGPKGDVHWSRRQSAGGSCTNWDSVPFLLSVATSWVKLRANVSKILSDLGLDRAAEGGGGASQSGEKKKPSSSHFPGRWHESDFCDIWQVTIWGVLAHLSAFHRIPVPTGLALTHFVTKFLPLRISTIFAPITSLWVYLYVWVILLLWNRFWEVGFVRGRMFLIWKIFSDLLLNRF